jgi:hypothetical protein
MSGYASASDSEPDDDTVLQQQQQQEELQTAEAALDQDQPELLRRPSVDQLLPNEAGPVIQGQLLSLKIAALGVAYNGTHLHFPGATFGNMYKHCSLYVYCNAGIEPELADEDDPPSAEATAAAAAATAAVSAADPIANGDAANNAEQAVAAAPAAAVAKPVAASTAAAKRTRRAKPKAAGPQLDVLLVATGTGASEKARHCVAATLVDQWNVEAWNILITEAQQGRYAF